jgi:hypothetical protein
VRRLRDVDVRSAQAGMSKRLVENDIEPNFRQIADFSQAGIVIPDGRLAALDTVIAGLQSVD